MNLNSCFFEFWCLIVRIVFILREINFNLRDYWNKRDCWGEREREF